MKLTKRLLAVLLLVCMVFSMLPAIALTASAANQTLSFSFTSCPSGWPSGGSGSANTKTYTVDGTAYTFSLGANVYYNTSKYLMLKYTTYLGLPAIEGYKLTKVVATGNKGASTKTSVAITTNTSGTAVSGGGAKTWSTAGSSYTYNLTGTSANTMYYIYVTVANCQITNLELTYESVGASYTLTASSNGHGTVGTPANGTVSCTPDGGYYLSGASVTAGSGLSVSVSGNTISYTGTQTANAVITATFSPKTAATLTYSENGTTHSASIGTKYVGDSVTLVAPATSTLGGGYEFVGWLPSTYAESDTAPTGLLEEGGSYILSAASNTLYAVYAIAGTGGTKTVYSLVTTPQSGKDYLFATSNAAGNAKALDAGSVTSPAAVTIEESNGTKYIETTDSNLIWAMSGSTSNLQLKSGTSTYLKINGSGIATATSGQSLYWSDSNGLYGKSGSGATSYFVYLDGSTLKTRQTGSTTQRVWAYEESTMPGGVSYTNYTTTVNTEATYYTLDYSANPAAGGSITCASTSGASIAEDTSVSLTATANTHYTFTGWTVDGVNKGSNATLNITMDADKTVVANFTAEPTYTVTITQAAGGTMTASKYSGIYAGETVTLTATPSAHYTFNGWQCTAGGASISGNTFTMPAANVTITGSFTEAAQYTVTYSVNGDTSVIPAKNDYAGTSYTLPTASDLAGYTFAGWVESAIGTETTTAPTVLSGSYAVPSTNKTLYAVYTRTEGGSGGGSSNEFTKVTTAPADWSGRYLLVYEADEDTGYVFSGVDAAHDYVEAEIVDDSIAIDDGMAIIEIEAISGGYSLKVIGGTNDGKYMYGTSGSNKLNFGTTANVNTIAISDGSAVITSNTSVLRFNKNSTDMRFRYYKSDTYTAQQPIQLYKKGTGTTYYTTTVQPPAASYTLTYSVSPASSGTIACDTPNNGQVEENEDVILTATAAEHFTFANWTVTGTDAYVADGNEIIVTMTDDVNVTANFTADPTYTVTVTPAAGGTMTASKTTGIYAGETITLTATPDTHYSFNGWQCTAGGASISGNTFTMPAANVTITGSFTEDAKYTVTFYASSLQADTGSALSTQSVYSGESATAPTPDSKDGFSFVGWYTTSGTWSTDPGVLTSATVNSTAVNADVTYYGVWAEGGSAASEYTTDPVQTLDAIDDTVIIDWALPVTFNVLTNDNINVTVDVTAGTLPSGVTDNGNGSFTYTPSGWQTTDQTFDYTISGTVNGESATDTATVTLKTADSVYYEDTYSGIFTFEGNWTNLADGDPIAEQTSSLGTADIFEYDANYESYAMYSGGTAKKTTVSKGGKPTVSFTFAGTGFDVISATTNNSGAVLMTIKDANNNDVIDPVTHRNLNAIYDNFRGYVYCEEEFTRYTLAQVERCNDDGTPNPTGDYYYDRDNDEYKTPDNGKWYTQPEGDTGVYYNIEEAEDSFDEYENAEGTYIIKGFTSNWLPYDKAGGEVDNYYQIPIIKVTGLSYGTYTVTLTPTYSAAYDRVGDGSYDFIFDGVRIHNPVANRAAEYKYISINDAVKAGKGFGSGEVVECNHVDQEWSDWTFYSRARNTNSETTNNRGSFVQYCSYCGGVANTAYFHVNVTADDTELGVGGYNDLPDTTVLRYTLTADACANQAAIQAKLDALTGSLTERWSSNSGGVMTCTSNSNVVSAKGEGTTYATLQLKDSSGTIYASAIHSPTITVYADETHEHTFGAWTHDENSDPSTHTHTCTGENCSFYETEECVFTEEVTLEPTQTTPGSKTCTCATCGHTYTEEIPALGGFTATFHVPAGATAPAAQTGNSVTMPAAVAAPADFDAHNYTFAGWIGTTVSDTTTEQSFYEAGASIDLSADTDFYALYSYEGEGSGNTYKMVTSEPANWEGKYIIVNPNKDHAMSNTLKSGSNEINASAITVTDNKVVNPSADLIWELTKNPNNASQYSLYNEAGNVYAGITGASSTNASLNSTENFFTIEETGTDNVYDITSVTNSARCFSYYGTNETFRTYAKSANNTGYLFKQAGALTYTTNLAATCKHTNTTTTTVNPNCTVAGSETVTCNDCGETVSTTVLPALGHDYQITSADATGTTYTCSRCGDIIFEAAEFEVTYVLQPGVTVSGNSREGNAITLPNAASIPATYNAHDDYELVGWKTSTGSDTETNPSTYAKGATVTITEDTTFYPVYKFSTTTGGGTQEAGYYLATSVPAVNDNFIIAFKNGDSYYALPNGNKSSGASIAGTALTVNNGKATATSAITFTLISNSGNYGVKSTEAANYLGFNSNKISMNGWGDTKYATIAAASDGMFTITSTNNSPRGLSYSGTNFTVSNSGASPVYIFTYTEGGTGGGTTTTTYTFELKAASDSYAATLTPATLNMTTGSTASLTATLTNNGAVVTAEDVEFSSSNTSIVLVDEDTGYLVAGETAGTATITVKMLAADGELYTATCAVTVKEQSDNPTVNYIGSQTGKVYNWGTRGTTASFLTELADNYYTGSYSYDTLSALSGNSGSGTDFYTSALGTAIHNMLTAKQTSTTSYGGTTSLYAYTDCIESDTAHISSYYSAKQVNSTWDSGSTWNREHTWPNSKGLDGSDENDIMMLRPTSVSENSSRGNTAYGEGSGYYDPNKHGQNLHGDVARLMLQHLMRWGNTSKFYGSGGVMESRAILLKWLAEDPVDTWELGRNDAVQRITGVRNVFVDYPELAFKLLGAEVPANYSTPSKSGIVAAATYSASAGSDYEPVTEGSGSRSIAPAALTEKPATRSIAAGSFNGAVIIDGKGTANTFDDFAAYGPNNEVYLAPGQGIVFSLSSDIAITSQDLQIGAKAVNGTATAIDVASISNGTESTGIRYLLESKAIASATEMYYELDTTQMGWNGTESSVIVIYNSGSGVLSLTNLRYSTVNNNTLTMNINDVETQPNGSNDAPKGISRMRMAMEMIRIVYGEPITDPDPIEPTDLDLNFASAELVLNSDIAINFNVEEAVMDSADGVYAVFTKALYNEAGEITGYAEETVNEASYNEETGKYSFRFTGINPAEMGSAVTATLYGYRDGELISGKTVNYSVLTYINNMYGKVESAEFRALLADLAAYGEAAQNYVSYNTANLVTASVADGLMAYATAEAPELSNVTAITGEGAVSFTGAYLSLREKVTVCYTIDASEYAGNVADLELRIFDGARQIGTASLAEADGKYIASFSGLNALQMRTVLTAEVYDGDTCVSNTLDYSIESYCSSKAAGSDALAALVNALMNFGISAEAYFD